MLDHRNFVTLLGLPTPIPERIIVMEEAKKIFANASISEIEGQGCVGIAWPGKNVEGDDVIYLDLYPAFNKDDGRERKKRDGSDYKEGEYVYTDEPLGGHSGRNHEQFLKIIVRRIEEAIKQDNQEELMKYAGLYTVDGDDKDKKIVLDNKKLMGFGIFVGDDKNSVLSGLRFRSANLNFNSVKYWVDFILINYFKSSKSEDINTFFPLEYHIRRTLPYPLVKLFLLALWNQLQPKDKPTIPLTKETIDDLLQDPIFELGEIWEKKYADNPKERIYGLTETLCKFIAKKETDAPRMKEIMNAIWRNVEEIKELDTQQRREFILHCLASYESEYKASPLMLLEQKENKEYIFTVLFQDLLCIPIEVIFGKREIKQNELKLIEDELKKMDYTDLSFTLLLKLLNQETLDTLMEIETFKKLKTSHDRIKILLDSINPECDENKLIAIMNENKDILETEGSKIFLKWWDEVGAYEREITSVITYLLENKVNFNFKDEKGNTPLITAFQGDKTLLIKALLDLKADTLIQNDQKETAITLALADKNIEFFQYCIANEIPFINDIKNAAEMGPILLLVIEEKDVKTLSWLLDHGVNPNNFIKGDFTLLTAVIDKAKKDAKEDKEKDEVIAMFQILLEKKANPDQKESNKFGLTPLALAIESEEPKFICLLLQHGVTINDELNTLLSEFINDTQDPDLQNELSAYKQRAATINELKGIIKIFCDEHSEHKIIENYLNTLSSLSPSIGDENKLNHFLSQNFSEAAPPTPFLDRNFPDGKSPTIDKMPSSLGLFKSQEKDLSKESILLIELQSAINSRIKKEIDKPQSNKITQG